MRNTRGRGTIQIAAIYNTRGGTENKDESFNSSISNSENDHLLREKNVVVVVDGLHNF